MKRIHLAIATHDIAATVQDYSNRFGCEPVVVVPGEYALWRTETLNLSVRQDSKAQPGTLRHLGWEDDSAEDFTTDTDCNGILWERFAAHHQAAEINEIWPGAHALGESSSMNAREIQAGLAATPGYRYAELVGHQLFVAGQVPHDEDGNLVGIDNPQAQATQCLQNLRTLIELHGFGDRDIRQLTIYVVGDQTDLEEVWKAVTAWFDNTVPPATLLGVARLGHVNQAVEIDATIIRNP